MNLNCVNYYRISKNSNLEWEMGAQVKMIKPKIYAVCFAL